MKIIKSNTYYFLLLYFISFIFRLTFILAFQFDGLYGQDAYTYYDNSGIFLQSVLNLQAPPNFYWPIGYCIFTSIFSLLTWGNIGYSALLVSLNAGSLCSGVMFLLTYELIKDDYEETERKKIALYAGLIFCFSGVVVKSSIVIMSDALGLLLISLSMLFFVKYYNRQKLSYIVLSWVFMSLAVMTRYAYLLMLIPFGIYLFYLARVNTYNRGTAIKHFVFAVFAGIIVFLPQLYYIIKYGIAYLPKEEEARTWVMEWSPVNFFIKDFMTKDGTMHYKIWNAFYYLSPVFHPLYLSLFGFASIYGIITLIKKKQYRILFFCIIWVLFFYLYLGGSPYQSLRYTMSFLPALVIISSVGLGSMKPGIFTKVFLSCGLAALIIYDVYHIKNFAEQKQGELDVVNWVNSSVPAGSQLFAFEITPAINHYSKIKPYEFYLVKQNELKNIIDSSRTGIYFILPEEKLNTQWKGLPIEENFRYLKSNYKLIPVTELNYYKVYRLSK